MTGADQTVQVTLPLSHDLYERVAQAASDQQRTMEDVLTTLVAEGLETHATAREILERLSDQYRARLDEQHQLHRSPAQVLQDLRDCRERIADALYPG